MVALTEWEDWWLIDSGASAHVLSSIHPLIYVLLQSNISGYVRVKGSFVQLAANSIRGLGVVSRR